jgi:lipopolysaccharide export system protein LptA
MILILLANAHILAASDSATPNQNGPIKITADRFFVDNRSQMAEFSGNVTAIQGNTQITADRLILHYGGQGDERNEQAARNIKQYEALGNVRILFDNRVAVSDKAVYTTKDRKLILRGPGSMIKDGEDKVSGGEIIFERDTEKVFINKGQHEGQVKAIINSDQMGLD